MEKVIGSIIPDDKFTYNVRACVKGMVADNDKVVSSKTAGKTHRVAGNLDATWEISLCTKNNESEIPNALNPGRIISLQLKNDAQAYTMIIDSVRLKISGEPHEQTGISLSCSANSATSYRDRERS